MLSLLTTKEQAGLISSLLPGFIAKGAIKLPWSFKLWEIHTVIIQQREHWDIITPKMIGRKSERDQQTVDRSVGGDSSIGFWRKAGGWIKKETKEGEKSVKGLLIEEEL